MFNLREIFKLQMHLFSKILIACNCAILLIVLLIAQFYTSMIHKCENSKLLNKIKIVKFINLKINEIQFN